MCSIKPTIYTVLHFLMCSIYVFLSDYSRELKKKSIFHRTFKDIDTQEHDDCP